MIQLNRPSLTQSADNQLSTYQSTVDSTANFPMKVSFAKEDFPKKNVIGNKTFDEVKTKLIQMSSGAERCHYCEDSKADEVEHMLPKDAYPDQCYNWKNYLYSCGSCNTRKGNKCAVIDNQTNTLIDNTPPKKKKNGPPLPPPTPPHIGQQALIDISSENPLDYFLLDLSVSFEFSELPNINTSDYLRAKFTLETLQLNKRAFLRKARQKAYTAYKARLTEYIHHKNIGTPQNQLDVMINELKTESHPTVWKEMVRQRNFIPALNSLFMVAPEAINW